MIPTRGITLSAPQRRELVALADGEGGGGRLNPTLCALERRGLAIAEWTQLQWRWQITNAGRAAIAREPVLEMETF